MAIIAEASISNTMSALRERDFVNEAITDLIERVLVIKCDQRPKRVNPLSVYVQSNRKKRLILDLRLVNKHLWKQSENEDLRLTLMYLEPGSWMIKFDIHSAYHFVDMYLSHTEFLGFS